MKFALAAILAVASHALKLEDDSGDVDPTCVDWVLEECSGLFRQNVCGQPDVVGECGSWYATPASDQHEDKFWVTCKQIASWGSCSNSTGEEEAEEELDEYVKDLIKRWEMGFRIVDTNGDGLKGAREMESLMALMVENGLKSEEDAKKTQAWLVKAYPEGLPWKAFVGVIHGTVEQKKQTYQLWEAKIRVLEDNLLAKMVFGPLYKRMDTNEDGCIRVPESEAAFTDFAKKYPNSLGEDSAADAILDNISESDACCYTKAMFDDDMADLMAESYAFRESLISDAVDKYDKRDARNARQQLGRPGKKGKKGRKGRKGKKGPGGSKKPGPGGSEEGN